MKKKRTDRKYLLWFWGLFALPFVALFLIFFLISKEALGPIPTFEDLENPDNKLAAQVISEDNVALGRFFRENRTWADYEEISTHMVDALIATEDIRFHRHSGIDFRSLVRVAVKNVLMGQKQAGGGSTITQQLAKNLFVARQDTRGHGRLRRSLNLVGSKFKEWHTAVKLERSYTKEEIITMYLNVFDFINQAQGIRSAAHVYFNTTPDSLDILQSATLVGMLQNPSEFNPRRRPERTRARRNVVISQMARYGYISPSVADSLRQQPLVLDFREQSHTTGPATYFREYLRTTMIAFEPVRENFFTEEQYLEARYRWDNDPLYGWCRKNFKPDGSNYNLYDDGLKIYTTINSTMQQYAEEALLKHLDTLQSQFNSAASRYRNAPFNNFTSDEEAQRAMDRSVRISDRYRSMSRAGIERDSIMKAFNTPVPMTLFSYEGMIDTVMTPLDSIRYYKFFARSAFMAMEPRTGHVKAYVGGANFNYIKYDGVTAQRRQSGSTIKPFLYTLAIQDGKSPCDKVRNVPSTWTIEGDTVPWTPRSSVPPEFHGQMVTLRWGLAHSENYVSAALMKWFSPQAVADLMRRMGIRSHVPAVPSIFLGTADLSLEELVAAYNTYANKGIYTRPQYVTRIEDRNGNVIASFAPEIDEVLTESQAYLMTNLLRGVVEEGSGRRIRFTYELMNHIGGKTGTTQQHADGWFVGITPELVGGVWTGWEDRTISFEDLARGQGANMALPIFGLFLQKLYSDPQFSHMAESEFDPPPGFDMDLDCDDVAAATGGLPIRYRF